MKNLVAFFEIPATDFGRAVKFYEEVFGLKLAVMECDTEKMAFFPEEAGGVSGLFRGQAVLSLRPTVY